MDENGDIFDHCAERTNEPGEIGQDVLFCLRVEDDLLQCISPKNTERCIQRTYSCTIGSIAEQAEHEEEEGKALAGFFTLVLDDLGNAGSKVANGACVA